MARYYLEMNDYDTDKALKNYEEDLESEQS